MPFDIAVDRDADPAGLLTVIQATGAMLAAIVRTTPAQVRAWHTFGMADPEGFAAMGIVETVVHTHDIATGLGLDWVPPPSLCAKTLARLFPTAASEGDPWQVLLWATGRVELPGRGRLGGGGRSRLGRMRTASRRLTPAEAGGGLLAVGLLGPEEWRLRRAVELR